MVATVTAAAKADVAVIVTADAAATAKAAVVDARMAPAVE
jgi:hypothetical protein